MKQIIQDLRLGRTEVVESPTPSVQPGTVVIQTARSLVSAGTERMLVEFGRANLLEKARQQPEKVRMVIERMRTDGILSTIEAVRSKLDQPLPLGYCNAGRVIAVGERVTGLAVGDRVASNGYHAEFVRVPSNLCAKIPDGVPDEAAAFTVLGSIALQGLRLAGPTLGETFVVMGLGLIGLLTVQLLAANGCRVLGIDPDERRLQIAESLGALALRGRDPGDLEKLAASLTSGRGVDGVLITASTQSSEPVRQAARMCRKRGRIVLVGVTGLELSRAEFYEKELTFQVSCSYGPGRYDARYEEQGIDYPVGYVRWTEQRNFEAVLQMMALDRLQTQALITHRFAINRAGEAYDVLAEDKSALGIVLTYNAEQSQDVRVVSVAAPVPRAQAGSAQVRAGFIGAGNYASRVLIPSFSKGGIDLHTLVTTGSVQGTHSARKFGFAHVATDTQAVLGDADVNLVVIATRHDSHAELALAALAAGKHVFVEKPLAITLDQVERIESAVNAGHSLATPPTLTVGFNRRFAPLITVVRRLLAQRRGPKSFVYTVNAGAIPDDHWTQDRNVGGGRVIGEVCHFIDLLRFVVDAPIRAITAAAMRADRPQQTPDTVTINLSFEDGSVGAIQYYANGSASFPKERLEIFMDGAVLRLNNFRRLESFGWPGFGGQRSWRVDKGQVAMASALKETLAAGRGPLIPAQQILEVARATIACSDQLELTRS